MAAEQHNALLAAACEYLGVGIQYLARAAQGPQLPVAAPTHPHPLPLHQLQMAAGVLPQLPMAGAPAITGYPLARVPVGPPRPPQRHRLRIRDDDDNEDEPEGDEEVEPEGDNEDEPEGDEEDGDGLDDFSLVANDAWHLTYPVAAAAAPYLFYRVLPDSALATPFWIAYLVFNALLFTAAVTVCAVMVLRSSSRCLPTFLRALLLALTTGAEIAAAAHLQPGGLVPTILAIAVVVVHVIAYLWVTLTVCRRCRRRLHPAP